MDENMALIQSNLVYPTGTVMMIDLRISLCGQATFLILKIFLPKKQENQY